MADFSAEDKKSAEVCVRRLSQSDVYVGIIGLRYGSPVRGQLEGSYTELEFNTATKLGMHRLLFLLDERSNEHGIPIRDLYDTEYVQQQAAFRRRLRDCGATVAFFRNPDHLQTLLERSLRDLAEAEGMAREQERKGSGGEAPWPWWGAISQSELGDVAAAERLRNARLLPHLPNRGPQDTALNRALRELLSHEQARPITVIAYGDEHQALEHYFDRFWEVNLPDILLEHTDISSERHDVLWSQVPLRREFDQLFDGVLHQCLPRDLQPDANPRPHNRLIVLRSDLNSDDWGSGNGAERLTRICRYWAEGQQWQGWRIIHWISIKLLRPGLYEKRGLRPRWLKKSYWDHRHRCIRKTLHAQQIRNHFHGDTCADWAPPTTLVLAELDSVRRGCAEAWANSVKVQRVVPDWAIDTLRDELVSFYAEQENRLGILEVPMRDLASHTKALLDQLQQSLSRAELTR
jgi:hypothetical protein